MYQQICSECSNKDIRTINRKDKLRARELIQMLLRFKFDTNNTNKGVHHKHRENLRSPYIGVELAKVGGTAPPPHFWKMDYRELRVIVIIFIKLKIYL